MPQAARRNLVLIATSLATGHRPSATTSPAALPPHSLPVIQPPDPKSLLDVSAPSPSRKQSGASNARRASASKGAFVLPTSGSSGGRVVLGGLGESSLPPRRASAASTSTSAERSLAAAAAPTSPKHFGAPGGAGPCKKQPSPPARRGREQLQPRQDGSRGAPGAQLPPPLSREAAGGLPLRAFGEPRLARQPEPRPAVSEGAGPARPAPPGSLPRRRPHCGSRHALEPVGRSIRQAWAAAGCGVERMGRARKRSPLAQENRGQAGGATRRMDEAAREPPPPAYWEGRVLEFESGRLPPKPVRPAA